MILAPNNSVSALVRSLNETFDWNIDDGNYCQLVFVTSKSKSKVIADIILWFNHLLEYVNDGRHNKDSQAELLCTVRYTYHYEI